MTTEAAAEPTIATRVTAAGTTAILSAVVYTLVSITAIYGGRRGLVQVVVACLSGPWLAALLSRRMLARDGAHLSIRGLALGTWASIGLLYPLAWLLSAAQRLTGVRVPDVEGLALTAITVSALYTLPFFVGALAGCTLDHARLRHRRAAECARRPAPSGPEQPRSRVG